MAEKYALNALNALTFSAAKRGEKMIDERNIEGKLVHEIEKIGGLCLKLDSSSKKGIQDRLVLLPGATVAFVELKKPGGRVSVLQRIRQRQIERLGFPACVIGSEEALDNFLMGVNNTIN